MSIEEIGILKHPKSFSPFNIVMSDGRVAWDERPERILMTDCTAPDA
ncbi:MAG TPA: hypothetical protein VGZ24_04180 [Chthoniobacterales bacterium]|nr:hypothetical protein [Chthoniobacterales bacterium]